MSTESQNLSREMILRAYKAPLHLSRVLYKSTLFLQNKPNLLNAQMNVTSFYTVDYENKRLADVAKTKPIQSQYKANTNPIPERPKMNVTSILTKDYENKPPSDSAKTKPKQTQSNPIYSEPVEPTCSELACPELVEPVEGVEPISNSERNRLFPFPLSVLNLQLTNALFLVSFADFA